jgi:hypothetical protein
VGRSLSEASPEQKVEYYLKNNLETKMSQQLCSDKHFKAKVMVVFNFQNQLVV